ncbi:MAG: hypothetical protein M3R16_10970 [Pseudomonadota bacterium]|nr:hypothetical protein [Pseudomonadota bacterium]
MSQFEFFMAFYGLLLGLAVAELLLGFGNLVRAARQPRWGVLTPLLGLNIFVQLIASFADAWMKLKGVSIDFAGITAPSLIGVSFFAAAILVTPRDAGEWPSLDDYYFARGRWAVAALISVNMLTILFLELGSGRVAHYVPAAQIAYVVINTAVVGSLLVAFFSRRPRVIAAGLAVASAIVVLLYATPLDINGLTASLLQA